jgi:hypothetical protein
VRSMFAVVLWRWAHARCSEATPQLVAAIRCSSLLALSPTHFQPHLVAGSTLALTNVRAQVIVERVVH